MDDDKLFAMPYAKVYGCLVAKAERKGRTRQEVDGILCLQTGRTQQQLEDDVANCTLREFYERAPAMDPVLETVTGTICGVRIGEITDPLMRRVRITDKLIDELAKGRPMEKILRRS